MGDAIPIGVASDPRVAPGLDFPAGTRVSWRNTTYEKGSGDPTDWSALGSLSEAQTFTVEDAGTNTSVDVVTVQHATTGTAADNLGAAFLFQVENDNGDQEDCVRLGAYFTDITDGTEDAKLGISCRVGGAALPAHTSPHFGFFVTGTVATMDAGVATLEIRAGATQGQLSDQAGNVALAWDDDQNVVAGVANLVVGATDGFLYIPIVAGTPTGTPTTKTGFAPIALAPSIGTHGTLYLWDGAWGSIALGA